MGTNLGVLTVPTMLKTPCFVNKLHPPSYFVMGRFWRNVANATLKCNKSHTCAVRYRSALSAVCVFANGIVDILTECAYSLYANFASPYRSPQQQHFVADSFFDWNIISVTSPHLSKPGTLLTSYLPQHNCKIRALPYRQMQMSQIRQTQETNCWFSRSVVCSPLLGHVA